eukprot:8022384-Prorocentrum_lima.AAC.1
MPTRAWQRVAVAATCKGHRQIFDQSRRLASLISVALLRPCKGHENLVGYQRHHGDACACACCTYK